MRSAKSSSDVAGWHLYGNRFGCHGRASPKLGLVILANGSLLVLYDLLKLVVELVASRLLYRLHLRKTPY